MRPVGAVLVGAVAIAVAVVLAGGVVIKESPVAKWTRFEPGIPVRHSTEDLLFESGVGLVLGHRAHGTVEAGQLITEIMARDEAFILRLAPGAKAWKQVFSARGAMFFASSAGGGVIYALGESYFPAGSKVAFLEKSVDLGETWRPLPPPPLGLKGIRFAAEGRGWAWTTTTVFATRDDGKSWREVVAVAASTMVRDDLAPAIDPHGGVWVADGARVRRVHDKENIEIRLPEGARPEWLEAAADGAVWVVCVMDERGPVRVYRLEAGREAEQRAELPSFLPERLHVGRQLLLLAGTDVGEGDRAPVDFMLASRDGGRTWTREKPAIVSRMNPIHFESDEAVWAYAGMGRIQRRLAR